MIFQDIDVVIVGEIREPLLILEWIIVFLFFQLALIFYLRIINLKEKQLRNLQEKAYISFFLGFSLSKLFYIIGDYYVTTFVRMIFYNIAYIVQTAGIFFFVLILEKYKKLIFRRLFTIIYAILMSIFSWFFIFSIEYTQTVSFMFYPSFILFFLVYVKIGISDFFKKKELGSYSKDLLKFLIGFFAAAVGFAFASDMAANLFGREIRILGDVLEIVGFILVFSFFISVPSFSEYDWQEKIELIYLLHKSGQLVFSREFRHITEKYKQQIIGGTIASVKLMLEKLTEAYGISIIEQENKILIILPGNNFIAILISDQKLKSLEILLKNFLEKVETIYREIIGNWKGDLSIFNPIDNIVKEIFF